MKKQIKKFTLSKLTLTNLKTTYAALLRGGEDVNNIGNKTTAPSCTCTTYETFCPPCI